MFFFKFISNLIICNTLSITGTVTTYIFLLYLGLYFVSLPSLFFIFRATDLKRNNSCNYSARLALIIGPIYTGDSSSV